MTNYSMFLVGGAVRDQLLGLNPKDYDFAVVGPADTTELYEWLVREHRLEIFLLKAEYGTIRGRFPKDHDVYPGLAADFVIARKDGYYSDGRRPDSTQPGTLLDDLTRRDFTVNAMARDLDGVLIDPFNGEGDLLDRYLTTPRDAHDTLLEDSLRAYRAVRFVVTKGFVIGTHLNEAMHSYEVIDALHNVSVERIREELHKAFKHSTSLTIKTLARYPQLFDRALDAGLWLEPTLKGH